MQMFNSSYCGENLEIMIRRKGKPACNVKYDFTYFMPNFKQTNPTQQNSVWFTDLNLDPFYRRNTYTFIPQKWNATVVELSKVGQTCSQNWHVFAWMGNRLR